MHIFVAKLAAYFGVSSQAILQKSGIENRTGNQKSINYYEYIYKYAKNIEMRNKIVIIVLTFHVFSIYTETVQIREQARSGFVRKSELLKYCK